MRVAANQHAVVPELAPGHAPPFVVVGDAFGALQKLVRIHQAERGFDESMLVYQNASARTGSTPADRQGDDGAACQQRPDLVTAPRGHFDHGGAGDTARPSARPRRAWPARPLWQDAGRYAQVRWPSARVAARPSAADAAGSRRCPWSGPWPSAMRRVRCRNSVMPSGHDHRARAVTRRAVVARPAIGVEIPFAPV